MELHDNEPARPRIPIRNAVAAGGVRVREASVADAHAIASVHVEAWRAAYRGILPAEAIESRSGEQRVRQWDQLLRSRGPDSIVMVAETPGERVVGFASAGSNRQSRSCYQGELYALYVLPSQQRRGIGEALLRAIARGVGERGLHSILAWVLAANPARGFYERLDAQLLPFTKTVRIGNITALEVAYGWEDINSLIDG